MSTVRRGKSPRKPSPEKPDVSLRALVLLLTACAAGYVIYQYPQAAPPMIVVLGVLAALDRLVGR